MTAGGVTGGACGAAGDSGNGATGAGVEGAVGGGPGGDAGGVAGVAGDCGVGDARVSPSAVGPTRAFRSAPSIATDVAAGVGGEDGVAGFAGDGTRSEDAGGEGAVVASGATTPEGASGLTGAGTCANRRLILPANCSHVGMPRFLSILQYH